MSGERITAVIVGGGAVATRKAKTLHETGATVRVIAPDVTDELAEIAAASAKLIVLRQEYAGAEDLRDADVVIAATDSITVNSRIAADARALHRLVSVVNAPGEGTFTSMAIHRSGPLLIGVSAGRVPGAAARIRDAIAQRFDQRYAAALALCAGERTDFLENDARENWAQRSEILLGPDFCARVESGEFEEAAT